MLQHSHDKNYLNSPLESYIGDSIKNCWISLHEPYRDLHTDNPNGTQALALKDASEDTVKPTVSALCLCTNGAPSERGFR
jgi:hypothetical protein